MKTFADLQFVSHPSLAMGGVVARVNFPNGYGASVIMGDFSYGGNRGLYELAVLKSDDICYDTPIASDVIGYLTRDEVSDVMRRIQELEPEAVE